MDKRAAIPVTTMFFTRSSGRRSLRGRAAAVAAAAMLVLPICQPAAAQAPPDPLSPVTGNATTFDGLGSPYGGCGLPQAQLDTPHFVALNVYDTPGDYSSYPRPLSGTDVSKMGIWKNGLNCGRWVQVTIGDYCRGTNDGAQGRPFCRNGSWTGDAYNGATLTMQVADSCGDSNAWCRDDPYHLDLARGSLNLFTRNGTAVGDMDPNHWNNRHVSWRFVSAPAYAGDIRIGFMQGAQVHWPAIVVSHLANGIHGVEYYSNGSWTAAKMNSDMGQSYIIGGTTSGASTFKIRVRDAGDQLIEGGRGYNFSLPSSCGTRCTQSYTAAIYTTSPGGSTSSPPPPTSPPGRPCTADSVVDKTWSGGFQSTVTVKAGSAPVSAWTVTWAFSNGERVTSAWNATTVSSGATVTARNVSYNGSLAAGASTSFGFTGDGTPRPATFTCSSSSS